MTYRQRCSHLCDCTCTWQGGGAATGQRAPLSCRGLEEVGCPCGQRRCPHFTALPDRNLSRWAVLTAHLAAHRGGDGDKRIHPISNHKCPPIRPCESRFDGKMVRLLCVLDKPRHHGGDLRALGVGFRANAPVSIVVENAVLHCPEERVLGIERFASWVSVKDSVARCSLSAYADGTQAAGIIPFLPSMWQFYAAAFADSF